MDVYNSAIGTWSTAQLSVAREIIAATSVRDVALFAGGYTQGKLLRLWCSLFVACVSSAIICYGVVILGSLPHNFYCRRRL